MGVVHVQPGAVGQDDVGEAEILVGELRRVRSLGSQVEAPGVAERVLLLEVPARPARPRRSRRLVGVDHLGRADHSVHARLAGHGNAVLGLDAHNPARAHALEPNAAPADGRTPCLVDVAADRTDPVLLDYRYWPVLDTVSIDRPASVPLLPEMSVRM